MSENRSNHNRRERRRRNSGSDLRSKKTQSKQKLDHATDKQEKKRRKYSKALVSSFQKNYERVLLDSKLTIVSDGVSTKRTHGQPINQINPDTSHRSKQFLFISRIKTNASKLVKRFREHILKQHYVIVHLEDGSLAAQTVKALGLTQKHLRLLKKKFDDIDVDKSGFIDQKEFFRMFHEEPSPFTDLVFSFIDLDNSGEIDFDEFVRVCARYCMFTQTEILRFWFDCFDEDGSGAIDEDEFVELCKTVNNKSPMFPGNFSQALTMFDVNDDGLIDFYEFKELNKRFPLILYPAFRLQDSMQKFTLGEQNWAEIFKRLQQSKTKFSQRNKSTLSNKLRAIAHSVLALNKAWKIHGTDEINKVEPNFQHFQEIVEQDMQNHRKKTIEKARLYRRASTG